MLLRRAIVKKTTIRGSGNEIISIGGSDVHCCYNDLWKTTKERENAHYQGIDITKLRNVHGLRVGNASAKAGIAHTAISEAYGNRFYIPLDFELLESHMTFYQSSLGNRLEYELTFHGYSRAIIATATTSRNRIDIISLEYEQPELERLIRNHTMFC